MNITDIFILAVALSMDAMIVSFSNGLIFRENRIKKSFMLGFTVGFFQFIMPIIGYFFARFVVEYVKPYSHWLIFLIFLILGLRFIKDSFSLREEKKYIFRKRYLLAVGVATSIDALFAGVSISLSGNSVFYPSIIIGIITFVNSMIGFWITNLIKNLSTQILEVFGGTLLILLGFKVLFTSIL